METFVAGGETALLFWTERQSSCGVWTVHSDSRYRLTFFPPQDVRNCSDGRRDGGRRGEGGGKEGQKIKEAALQTPSALAEADEGGLRVFLAESSTKSEEMSSSTPTSFLAMQV